MAKADGLYLENVNGAILDDVTVIFGKNYVNEIPSYWGECLIIDEDSNAVENSGFNCVHSELG